MKIDTEIQTDHQARLKIEVDAELLEQAKKRAARKIARQTKIPGFRPGKAPYHIVARHVGEATILEDAVDLLLDELYPQALEEAKITPFGPGTLKEMSLKEQPTLEFLVPLQPEVELADYRSLRLPYEPGEITDERVDQWIDRIIEENSPLEPVDGPVEKGHVVSVVINGELLPDEEHPEGQVIYEDREYYYEVGKELDEDTEEAPFNGFNSQLIGMQADEEKIFEHTFSEEHSNEAWRGRTARFRVQVLDVKKLVLQELTDEFVKTLGEFESVADFRQAVREALEREQREIYDEEYQETVIEQLIAQSKFKYPPQLVETEIDSLLRDIDRRMRTENLSLEIYLRAENKDEATMREELADVAHKRIQRTLLLQEIAEQENIEVDSEEFSIEASTKLRNILPFMKPKEAQRFTRDKKRVESFLFQLYSDKIIQLTLERLKDIASGRLEENGSTSTKEEESETTEAARAEASADTRETSSNSSSHEGDDA